MNDRREAVAYTVGHPSRLSHDIYDGKQVFDLCDRTFHAGKIGLWSKSAAVTYFDDLQLQHVR